MSTARQDLLDRIEEALADEPTIDPEDRGWEWEAMRWEPYWDEPIVQEADRVHRLMLQGHDGFAATALARRPVIFTTYAPGQPFEAIFSEQQTWRVHDWWQSYRSAVEAARPAFDRVRVGFMSMSSATLEMSGLWQPFAKYYGSPKVRRAARRAEIRERRIREQLRHARRRAARRARRART